MFTNLYTKMHLNDRSHSKMATNIRKNELVVLCPSTHIMGNMEREKP